MKQIVIIGCGGFGREVADVIDAINAESDTWDLVGFVDDAPRDVDLPRVAAIGSRVLGPMNWFDDAPRDTTYVIGIANGAVKRRMDEQLSDQGFQASILRHPRTTVGAEVQIGAGSIICAGVRVTTNVVLGRHVHLNLNTTVGHDAVIGNYVTANPLVAISGEVTLGEEVMMGTHSAILQGLTIGAGATAGASCCVVEDVAPGIIVKGVPAR